MLLPIGVYFFTFTQIAYLMDTWSGKVREYRLIHYFLFVTYFPHLIAGPILHHREMMPQFESARIYAFNPVDFRMGLSIFVIGLFKKIVLADGIAPVADAIFGSNSTLTLAEAWLGVLAYT